MKKMSTAETAAPQSSAAERTSASGASVSIAYDKGNNGMHSRTSSTTQSDDNV
jgi:hypothetical protein